MSTQTAPKYTKADFLNYQKLAEKLGADPKEVYKTMLQHYKMRTPIEYKSNGNTVKSHMIVRNGAKCSISSMQTNVLLNPYGFTKFVEIFEKRRGK